MRKQEAVKSSPDRLQTEIHALSTLAESISKGNNISFEHILSLLAQKHEKLTPTLIPTSIFSEKKLGIMEATIKYLKEEFRLSYHQIAILLKRDDRVIWVSYHNAIKKVKTQLIPSSTTTYLPLSIFTTGLGPLESIVKYFHDELRLSFKEIGTILSRDNRVVWSVYHKKRKKDG